jgi:hypothetical protein
MRRFAKLLIPFVALGIFMFPEIASSQRVIYVVCWKYVPEKNCNKCSDYFSVQNEDEAIRKCQRRGFAEPNYFPSVGRIRAWVLSHCTCGDDDSD